MRVFEAPDGIGQAHQQFLGLEVEAGGLGEEEAAALVEAAVHGVFDERRPGHALDDEAVGDFEYAVGGVGGHRRLGGENAEGGDGEGRQEPAGA